MDKLRRFSALLFVGILVVAVVGCAQIHSTFDGFTGKPMDVAATGGDIPGWYHFGEALNPFVHAVIAILRGVLGL